MGDTMNDNMSDNMITMLKYQKTRIIYRRIEL